MAMVKITTHLAKAFHVFLTVPSVCSAMQCTLLWTATMIFLCHSGRFQYCIFSMTELSCTFFSRPTNASQSLCKALTDTCLT